jgi:hypothetical protein
MFELALRFREARPYKGLGPDFTLILMFELALRFREARPYKGLGPDFDFDVYA